MKNAARLLLALALGSAALSAEGRTDERQAQLSGREYVRLEDWARLNQFQIRWLDREKTFQLSNRVARLTFIVNSCAAQINGVGTWLSFPINLRNGTIFISQLDLQKTLGPVLYPPPNKTGLKIKTICLDPGHGGKDSGNRVGSNEEKKYTLLLAQEVGSQLRRAGFKILFTRASDTFVDLPDRPLLANRRRADLFVSLHFNSVETARNEVNGVETYCLTPAGATSTNARGEGDTRWLSGNEGDEKNLLLAYQVQKFLTRELAVEDRGLRRARFAVLRDAAMPAILIESGFMSHPVEGRKIFDPAYRRQLARAIVDGVLAYKRIVKG
jgi:N-acetylmuramoyl-L-alanine amidase